MSLKQEARPADLQQYDPTVSNCFNCAAAANNLVPIWTVDLFPVAGTWGCIASLTHGFPRLILEWAENFIKPYPQKCNLSWIADLF